jgi:hypothetical protein
MQPYLLKPVLTDKLFLPVTIVKPLLYQELYCQVDTKGVLSIINCLTNTMITRQDLGLRLTEGSNCEKVVNIVQTIPGGKAKRLFFLT